MPAFNKRLRETTYAGMKIRPMGGGAVFVICALMSFVTIFNNNAYFLGAVLAVVSVGGAVFAVYELINDDDWRVRLIRFRSRQVRNKRQTML